MSDLPDSPPSPTGSPQPLPAAVLAETLEAAVEVIESGRMDIEEAAAEFGIPPESLHRYYRARNRHGDGDSDSEQGTDAAATRIPSLRESGKALDDTERESFQGNWQRSAPLAKETVTSSAAARFCSRFAILRWLVRDSRLDPTITFGTAVLVGGSLVAAVVFLRGALSPDVPKTPELPPPAVESLPVSHYTEKAQKVLRDFLQAEDMAAKGAFIRDPETNIPLMEKWLAQGNADLPRAFKFIFFEELIEYSGKRFIVFSGLDGPDAQPTSLIVDATADPMRVDWQATVAYQPMEWRSFLVTRPPGEYPFRVLASLSDAQAPGFEDTGRYLSVRLSIPGSRDSIHTFLARDSALGREVATTFLTQGSTAQPVVRMFPVLTFDDVPESEERVLITRLEAEDWMRP